MNSHNKLLAIAGAAMMLTACGGGGGGGGGGTTPDGPDFVSCTGDSCSLFGTINEDYTLDSTKQYTLQGVVKVGDGNIEVTNDADVEAIKAAGVTLTIPAGMSIKASDDGVLLVTRGSKLMANGTAANPITFSSLDADFDGEGEWGGVVIQGFAPQYGAGNTGPCFGNGTVCNVAGEGGSEVAFYGGNDPADNSGVIRYVRIAEGGLVAGPNNEVNGLTLQGVGYGTTVDYVHVHNNLDDGIEWFGGTVNVTHVVLTNNDDDDIDFDEGYQGNIQYALVQKNQTKTAPTGSNDPRGIEANSSDDEYVPQTDAAIANVTIIGGPVTNAAGKLQPGMRLRGAVNTAIYNTAVKAFDDGCVRIDDADTNGDGTADVSSDVTLVNVLGDCAGGFYVKRAADSASNSGATTITFDDAYAINESVASLGSATTINAVANGSGFVFDQTDYIGAVKPGTTAANAWWAGWTLPGVLGDASETPAAASFVNCNDANQTCTVSGTIDKDYTFVAGWKWLLSGVVKVGNGNVEIQSEQQIADIKAAGVTLTIRPGVNVYGLDDGVLLVTRGSKLIADGSASAPITFSSLDSDFSGEGEWGGVVLQGFAPQYGAGNTGPCFGAGTICNVAGEGGSEVAFYGGNDPADNSGVIRYVRIAEGGLVAGPNNEVNGLTLQGIGYGTKIDYVQVHSNLDDGIEWFGGTVNVTHAVLTNNDDDDIDFDEGYQGNIQYAIIQKNQIKSAPTGSNDPRGIEANSSDDEYVPQTDAAIANVLIIGGPVNNAAGKEQPGMRLRGALTTAIYNTAVKGFDTGCVRIDDADTNGDGTADVSSDVTLVNVVGDCADGFYDKRAADSETNSGAMTVTIDSAYAVAGGTVTNTDPVEINNGSGFTFDNTDYVGAVAPGTSAANAWWAGWTLDGTLN
ncbi:MAG: hypothetical protein PHP86_05295 [Nevskiales bacterium]|nr:hypothetical protein [Nevskiales bacterium]